MDVSKMEATWGPLIALSVGLAVVIAGALLWLELYRFGSWLWRTIT